MTKTEGVESLVRRVSTYAVYPCAVVLVGWILVFVVHIIGRNFGLGWLFVEEFTGYWLVFIAYMALAYGLVCGVHVRIELITGRLPQKTRGILALFTESLAVVLTFYLLARSIEWLIYGIEHELRSLSIVHILLWPTYLPVCIGLALFALALTARLVLTVIQLVAERRTR